MSEVPLHPCGLGLPGFQVRNPYILYCILYTIYYILYTIYYILYTMHYILYTTYYIP